MQKFKDIYYKLYIQNKQIQNIATYYLRDYFLRHNIYCRFRLSKQKDQELLRLSIILLNTIIQQSRIVSFLRYCY